MRVEESSNTSGFIEKSFSDYHLYTMEGATTLKDKQTKQLRLFGAANVPYRRYYEIAPYTEDAQIMAEFQNQSQFGLGIPFPAGKFKFYQRDSADDSLTFICEDEVDHTPKDEVIKLCIGEAFDLQCERVCLDQQNKLGLRQEKWQITLKNHKEESALIRVRHRIPANAEVNDATHCWHKINADEVVFEVNLNGNTTETIEFLLSTDERVHVMKHGKC